MLLLQGDFLIHTQLLFHDQYTRERTLVGNTDYNTSNSTVHSHKVHRIALYAHMYGYI